MSVTVAYDDSASLPNVTAVLITREFAYPSISLGCSFGETIVETNCPNVFRRYELARRAQHDVIYVQDDDCEIDVATLWLQFDGRLTNAIREHDLQFYRGTGVTLLGFGTFFPKVMVDFTRWTSRYEMDLDEADRIFSYLNQPHNSVVMPIRIIERATRMSDRPDHYDRLRKVMSQLGTL